MDRRVMPSSNYKPEPQGSLLQRLGRYFVGLAIFVLMLFLFVKAATGATMTQTDIVRADINALIDGQDNFIPWRAKSVTAIEIERDFTANELSANRTYNTGDIIVTGSVTSITQTVGAQVVLGLEGASRLGAPRAFLQPTQDDWAAGLRKGAKVTVACRKAERFAGAVFLRDCIRREAYVQKVVSTYVPAIPQMAKEGEPHALKLLSLPQK